MLPLQGMRVIVMQAPGKRFAGSCELNRYFPFCC